MSAVKYPFEGYTRVQVLPAVGNLAAPTLVEIAAGTDITCDLTADGLKLPRSTSSVDATPWAGLLEIERPTRRSMSGAALTGYRFRDPEDESLWPLAVDFKSVAFLLVRRGVPFEDPWASGNVVEAIEFAWGDRGMADTGNDVMATFTVPVFPYAQTWAVVA